MAVAASLAAMATFGSLSSSDPEPVLLPPVIASQPEPEPEARIQRLPASELLGPATAGIPVWPAALLAGETPVQFLNAGSGIELVSLQR
jgi:hypothetical protein